MLLNFQTMIADLTGLPIAGASLLDEATAVAEAAAMACRITKTGEVVLVSADLLPQSLAVLVTRMRSLGIEVMVAEGPLTQSADLARAFCVIVQTPRPTGACNRLRSWLPLPTRRMRSAPKWWPRPTCWR